MMVDTVDLLTIFNGSILQRSPKRSLSKTLFARLMNLAVSALVLLSRGEFVMARAIMPPKMAQSAKAPDESRSRTCAGADDQIE
jgi:hypothetical protein